MDGKAGCQRKGRVFYGYYLVAVTFVFMTLFNGAGVFVFSLFVRPLEAALGWGRAEVMVGFTIFYATMGLASPAVGRVVDRYGARVVIAAGALVMGLGFVIVSRMSDLFLFYFGYMIVGIGAAALGPVPCSTVIANWFKRNRGLALGLMAAGVGAGGIVMAPFTGYMLSHYDWRLAYLSLAVVLAVVAIPLALGVVRTRPSDMGLYPDGDESPTGEEVESNRATDATVNFTLRQALRTRAFWFISLAYACYGFGGGGTQQASVPFLEDVGYTTAVAATTLGIYGAGSTIAKIMSGRLCDRLRANHVFAIGAALLLSGILLLLTVRANSPFALLWTYAALLGLGAGVWLPTLSMLASTHFGLRHYGAVLGALNICMSLGLSFGPLFAGFMYDSTGSYVSSFSIFAILLFLAIPAILLVRQK
ncbi:MAG: MFS transporter [Dehalococcoidia bacterium]|nr:MFS transporter [Dehalococcoidia bacterium]